MRKNESVIFILPVTSQPRYLKRIEAFLNHDYNVKIFSFEREYFEGNNLPEFISLGKIKHGNYLNRIKPLFAALKILLNHKQDFKNTSLIYVFGMDNFVLIKLVLKFLRKEIPIVYEVADIREIMFKNNLVGSFFKNIERKIINKSLLTTVTSPYFISDYYEPELGIDPNKFFVIENKLYNDVPAPIQEKHKMNNDKLTIGYFGVLRCNKSWELLYELAVRHPDEIDIYIRGYLLNLKDFEKRVKEQSNIYYSGEYKSPHDLAELYSKVDITLIGNVANNQKNGNLALPNRLYESLFYNVPIIAHKNTAVARKAKSLNVGWEFDFDDIKKTIFLITRITQDNIDIIKTNMQVNSDQMLGNKEHESLIKTIEMNMQKSMQSKKKN